MSSFYYYQNLQALCLRNRLWHTHTHWTRFLYHPWDWYIDIPTAVNTGKYTIHGSYGIDKHVWVFVRIFAVVDRFAFSPRARCVFNEIHTFWIVALSFALLRFTESWHSIHSYLGGVLKYVLFSPFPGKMIQFDYIIFFRWVILVVCYKSSTSLRFTTTQPTLDLVNHHDCPGKTKGSTLADEHSEPLPFEDNFEIWFPDVSRELWFIMRTF